jgi:hypothetical protein
MLGLSYFLGNIGLSDGGEVCQPRPPDAIYSPETFSGTQVRLWAILRLEGLGKLKKSNNLMETRTRDPKKGEYDLWL